MKPPARPAAAPPADAASPTDVPANANSSGPLDVARELEIVCDALAISTMFHVLSTYDAEGHGTSGETEFKYRFHSAMENMSREAFERTLEVLAAIERMKFKGGVR